MHRVVCRCGHPRDAHEHYRAGSECAVCGAAVCARFRRVYWWHRLIRGREPVNSGRGAGSDPGS